MQNAYFIPGMDFETYSEAGYYLAPDGKWKGVTKTNPGIAAVGAPVYSEHPSTRVLSLAWDVGKGPMLWAPPLPPPQDLFDYIAAGGIIEAWNAAFEWYIWHNVCHKRMGWPALPYHQLRCAMAKARAHSLPGKLGKAAEVVGTEQKDKAGELLIRKLCIPTNGKKLPTTADYDALYKYNIQDIRAEASVSQRCPELSPFEQRVWLLDQAINFRGVHIDRKALSDCREIIRQATERYTDELQQLTGGFVQSVGELQNMTRWLSLQGVHTGSLESDAVEQLLAQEWVQGAPRRVLEIRAMLGAASVKKLEAINRMLCSDGRLRDLFVYCGADRTGRFAGRGPQPQNMPGGLPAEEVEEALALIATRDLYLVEEAYGNAVAVVSGCLRALFTAAPGHDLICPDFSAIEAVVLAELAGEEWRQEVFRTHGKIYETSASILTGNSLEFYAEYKAANDKHHPDRKKGKVAELACFGPNTLVLTDSGWKRIVDITRADMLSDGTSWVQHGGVVDKGERLTIKMGGVTVTPEHKFYLGGSRWATAEDLHRDTILRNQATGLANLLLSKNCASQAGGLSRMYAAAHAASKLSTSQVISAEENQLGATPALNENPLNQTPGTGRLAPTHHTERDCLTVCPQRSEGVLTPHTGSIEYTVGGGSPSTPPGSSTGCNGYHICASSLGGTTLARPSTGSTTTGGMSQETSGLSPTRSNKTINSKPCGWNMGGSECQRLSSTASSVAGIDSHTRLRESCGKECSPSKLLRAKTNAGEHTSRVYDVLNCGPRNRFVVMTENGPVIAHNSGYGGGLGAWKAFGADEFMTDDEIQEAVRTWRAGSPAIVAFWWGVQEAAVLAITNPGHCYSYRSITYGVQDDILYCLLPSGRRLTYHNPRVGTKMQPWGKETLNITYMGWNSNYLNGPVGWMRLETYGPKLTENVVQAVSRDILVNSMLNLDRAGYPIVLHVHDEIVAEVPHGWGSVEEFEQIMSLMPEWAAGWPVRAAGGWRGLRYRKD